MPGADFSTVRYPHVVVVVNSALRLKSMQRTILQFCEFGKKSKTVQYKRFDRFFTTRPFVTKFEIFLEDRLKKSI